ncbi:MAG: FkbM family methyltransferase [Pseudomonadota bacterium]
MSVDIFKVIGKKPPVNVVDVGAMTLGAEHDAYYELVKARVARVVGFEPVPEECERLNAIAAKGDKFLPYAIGDGSDGTLHVCNFPMNTSLYEPNLELLDRFQNLSHMYHIEQRVPVTTRRMHDIDEIKDVDFLKLDVQGAELDVLRGAGRCLDDAVFVHTEAEFVPMYKDQPLFAEVDQFLRQAGFQFHKFGGVAGRPFKPLGFGDDDDNRPIGQLLWSDAVYVKDFMTLETLPALKLLKLAIIAHLVYQSVDLAAQAFKAHDAIRGTNLMDKYCRRLTRS